MRTITNKLLWAIDDGLLDTRLVLMCALKYMSEDEVADMAHINELLSPEEDEDE